MFFLFFSPPLSYPSFFFFFFFFFFFGGEDVEGIVSYSPSGQFGGFESKTEFPHDSLAVLLMQNIS